MRRGDALRDHAYGTNLHAWMSPAERNISVMPSTSCANSWSVVSTGSPSRTSPCPNNISALNVHSISVSGPASVSMTIAIGSRVPDFKKRKPEASSLVTSMPFCPCNATSGGNFHDDFLVGRCRQYGFLVLVCIANFPQSKEHFVPGLVRLDRAKDADRDVVRRLCGLKTTFQFLGIIKEREVFFPVPGSPLGPDLAPKYVKRSSKVVGGVANNRSKSRRNRVVRLER